jgi:hypothetical protein
MVNESHGEAPLLGHPKKRLRSSLGQNEFATLIQLCLKTVEASQQAEELKTRTLASQTTTDSASSIQPQTGVSAHAETKAA